MNFRKASKTKQLFFKSWADAFYNPMFFTRKGLHQSISLLAPRLEGQIVDLGCGTKPYRRLFTKASEYIGMDIEVSGNFDNRSHIDVFYDGHTFPFANDSIDNIFSSETFEHIFNVEEILQEIHRVLKKDGLLLATCPFLWPEHEVPYDYARYTSFAIADMLKRNGFEIVHYEKTGNFITAVMQMQALYLYYFINRIPVLAPIFFILFITPLFLIGSILNLILPSFMKRKDLYLNNVFIAKKIA